MGQWCRNLVLRMRPKYGPSEIKPPLATGDDGGDSWGSMLSNSCFLFSSNCCSVNSISCLMLSLSAIISSSWSCSLVVQVIFNEIDAIFFLLKQNMTPEWLSCYFPRFLSHWRSKCVNGWQTDVTFWFIWKKMMHNLIKNNLYCCLYTCLFVWAVLCTIQDHFVADPWWWFNKPGKKNQKVLSSQDWNKIQSHK